jgi:hypothetical protein
MCLVVLKFVEDDLANKLPRRLRLTRLSTQGSLRNRQNGYRRPKRTHSASMPRRILARER